MKQKTFIVFHFFFLVEIIVFYLTKNTIIVKSLIIMFF